MNIVEVQKLFLEILKSTAGGTEKHVNYLVENKVHAYLFTFAEYIHPSIYHILIEFFSVIVGNSIYC